MKDGPTNKFPRIVRAVPDPLGLYLHAGYNDHKAILNMLATGDKTFFGAVFDPTKLDRHAELREQIFENKLDAILDPCTIRSATPGGFSNAISALPWGKNRPHNEDDFKGLSGRRSIGDLAAFTCEHGFTQVMAPSHYISNVNDPWLDIDIDSICTFRSALDKVGCSSVPMILPLAIPYRLFRNSDERNALIDRIRQLPVNSIWLSIDGVGRNSTSTAARNYIDAARDFHALDIPLVANHIGGGMFGLSLLAFGAVGGIAHGVMQNESYQTSHLKKPRKPSKFGRKRLVYVPSIDAMLPCKEAEILLSSRRAKAHFACTDSRCCPRGAKDMLHNHTRHYLYQRMHEVAGLSRMPETLRPQRFLDQHLRPATDKAVAATQIEWPDKKVLEKMQKNRKHLDTLRIALGDYSDKNPPKTFALHPKMRVARS